MTTEIFRNILYKQDQDLLKNAKFLILDEFHYMKDPERGTVWEESIIYAPKDLQIIALSATIGNPKEIKAWISKVHKKTELVKISQRPVPLERYFFSVQKGLVSLDSKQEIRRFLKNKSTKKSYRNLKKNEYQFPNVFSTLEKLKEKDFLPCIYFLFSRRNCEASCQKFFEENLRLINQEEKFLIQKKITSFLQENPWLENHRILKFLRNGYAPHHAGLIPVTKNLVEELFQENLLKLVFATETLAAGINMPARSTVISQISKSTGDRHRLLTSNEFLQMSGRAGRRRIDKKGYVIILETFFEGFFEILDLSKASPEKLNSSFSTNPIMILNLLSRLDLIQVKELMFSSFLHFQNNLKIQSLEKKLIKSSKKNKKNKLQEEINELKKVLWDNSKKIIDLLVELDYLTKDYKLTKKGAWTKELKFPNTLLVSEIIESQVLENFSVCELAGIINLLNLEEFKTKNSLDKKYLDQNQIIKRFNLSKNNIKIFEIIQKLNFLSQKHKIELKLDLNLELIEIGFDWCSGGLSWDQMLEKYKINEGDLYKILKRMIEGFKQIRLCSRISRELKNSLEISLRACEKIPLI